MNIVFMGTPDFAVPSLEALLANHYSIAGVVTQPDRPKGRKHILTPPPVKATALQAGLPILQPERMRNAESIEAVKAWQPDLIITAAFGQILPKQVLDIPRLGCINVHASLLPRYRGGAPIHHAIMAGEKSTGVTIMYMAEGLDTGDIISKVEIPITDDDTVGTLFTQLAGHGAKLLIDTLPGLLSGKAPRIAQNEDEATYAPNLSREDERIDWSRTTRQIYNQVRGLNPWPVSFTTWRGDVLKLWACEVLSENEIRSQPAGTVVHASAQGIDVQTGDGLLRIKVLQPAGKKTLAVQDFMRGTPMDKGTVLG